MDGRRLYTGPGVSDVCERSRSVYTFAAPARLLLPKEKDGDERRIELDCAPIMDRVDMDRVDVAVAGRRTDWLTWGRSDGCDCGRTIWRSRGGEGI